jgi:glycerate dehydrogenase
VTQHTPKIVVLDGYTTNPGDLSWDALQAHGTLTVHDRTAPDEVVARLADAEIALTNKVPLMRDTLLRLPKLRYIGILATGTNAVDLDAAQQRGIVVSNAPRYSTDSVAQLVFEALLDAVTHAQAHRAAVATGAWERSADFCFNVRTIHELAGKTLGIIGYGTIGAKVATIAAAFGMDVLVAQSLNPDAPKPKAQSPGPETRIPLDALLQTSDFITLHCPLTEWTRGVIGERELGLMKPSAVLINTARGPLVDELALAQALTRGRPAAAYLDVLTTEPPAANHPLLHHPACRITPHIGWTSHEARSRLIAISVRNVAAFLAGAPSNVVSKR